MGGVFAANMTGNTVLAGIAAAQRRYADAGRHLAPLARLLRRAPCCARLLLRLWHRPAMAILLEAAIIAVVGFLPIGIEAAVLILALAMGMQASAITHFGGAAVSTVVVTSTLARTAEATLDRLWPRREARLAGRRHAAAAGPQLDRLPGWRAIAGTLLLHAMP